MITISPWCQSTYKKLSSVQIDEDQIQSYSRYMVQVSPGHYEPGVKIRTNDKGYVVRQQLSDFCREHDLEFPATPGMAGSGSSGTDTPPDPEITEVVSRIPTT